MSEHDPYCKSYYPALTDPKTCTWCYVIREVRRDEYFKAWDEGFGIGYGEGYENAKETYTNDCFECGYAGEWSTWVCDDCQKNMSTNEDNDDMSLNEDDAAYVYEQGRSLRDEQRGIDSWMQDIQRGLDKWKEDIDVAYWQGYNNAMIEISEASAAGTSTPSAHTIEEILLHNMFDGDRGGLITMSVDILIKEVAELLSSNEDIVQVSSNEDIHNLSKNADNGKPPTTTQKLSTLGFLHLGTEDYMCPFCVTPWKCNGPHIEEGDMENFLLYMEDRNAESND